MSWKPVIKKLQAGHEVTMRPQGQSMTPKIRSGQKVTITPIREREIEVGNIVLSKVNGKHFLHLVSAIDHKGRIQISNNHGWINGWTDRSRIYGIVTKVES